MKSICFPLASQLQSELQLYQALSWTRLALHFVVSDSFGEF